MTPIQKLERVRNLVQAFKESNLAMQGSEFYMKNFIRQLEEASGLDVAECLDKDLKEANTTAKDLINEHPILGEKKQSGS